MGLETYSSFQFHQIQFWWKPGRLQVLHATSPRFRHTVNILVSRQVTNYSLLTQRHSITHTNVFMPVFLGQDRAEETRWYNRLFR